MKKMLSHLWSRWKKIAHTIGRFQTKLLLTIFYFLMISPIGAVMRLFGWDPLETRHSKARRDTNWKPIDRRPVDLDSMRRQS